jgi:hypothetical protein
MVDRLFLSFSELEQAINGAKATLSAKGTIPDDIMKRLSSYDEILAKQKSLAGDLCDSMQKENWDEVNRLVSLINGLSAMIRDDARAILSALALNTDHKEEEDINFC